MFPIIPTEMQSEADQPNPDWMKSIFLGDFVWPCVVFLFSIIDLERFPP
jgi:hypothetical protein